MHQSPHDEPYGFERRVLGSTYVRDDDYARYLAEQAPDLGGIRGIGLSCNGREANLTRLRPGVSPRGLEGPFSPWHAACIPTIEPP